MAGLSHQKLAKLANFSLLRNEGTVGKGKPDGNF